MTPSADTRRPENLALIYQEAMTAILRNAAQSIQTHNQQLTNLLAASIATANKDLTETLGRRARGA